MQTPNQMPNEYYQQQQQGYMPPPPPPKSGRGFRSLILVLLLLLVAGIVVQSTLFRIERVLVVGCINMSEAQVVEKSGLYPGQNMLSINAQTIEKSIDADRYLVFKEIKKDYTTRTVTLYIEERVPVATFQTLGIQYTIDSNGVILEQTEELAVIDGLIVLTGLKTDACILGRQLVAQNQNQLSAFQAIMRELNNLGCINRISELNVLDLGNLYLVSADGMAIKMGDTASIHAKVVSFFTVKEQLDTMGVSGGTVDVSLPVYPVYIP